MGGGEFVIRRELIPGYLGHGFLGRANGADGGVIVGCAMGVREGPSPVAGESITETRCISPIIRSAG